MKEGFLSQYFEGVAAKKISAVEANPKSSNQHEFNVTKDMISFLGRKKRQIFRGNFFYFDDENEFPTVDEADLTFYDSRFNNKNRAAEYRLYYQTNEITDLTNEGDLLILAKSKEHGLLVIIAQAGSTKENQLRWLFGIPNLEKKSFQVISEDRQLDFAANMILEQIGVEIINDAPEFLEIMLKQFNKSFPTTKVFSHFARQSLKGVSSTKDPDSALEQWMTQEEKLFKTLEKYFLQKDLERLQLKKNVDPDEYMQMIMSYQQRRKSRAGNALENHLEFIFNEHSLKYDRTKITEGNKKPDFIFPSIKYYHATKKDDQKLTMLAAKTTCKDRWRQVLNEADKIKTKYLITFEPSISQNQLDEMRSENVCLIVPASIQKTYSSNQQKWLMSVADLIRLLKKKQNSN